MNEEFVEKKSKLKVVITIIIILLIIGGIGFGGYYLLKKKVLNPEMYLESTKNYLINNISNRLNKIEIDNNKEKDSKENGNISFKTNSKNLDYFNKLKINYSILTSMEKEEIQSNIKLNEDSKNILDSNIYLQKDSLYLESKDLYNKILLLNKFDGNIFSSIKEKNNNSLSIKEIENIISNYISYIIDSFKEANMTSELVSFYQVKYTYEINDSNKDKVQKKYDELIKNDKTLELLFKDKFNIKFEPIKIEIIKSIGTGEIYYLLVDDNDIYFEVEQDKDNRDLYHIKDGNNTGSLEIRNDKWTFQEFENEILKVTVKLVNNKDLFKISVTDSDNDISFSLKTESKDTIGIGFSIKVKGQEEIGIDLSGTIKKVDNGYNYLFNADILIDGEKIKMELQDNIEYGDNLLESKDLNDYQVYDKLSEKERDLIYEKLYKKLEGTKLLELMNNNQENYS